MTGRRGGMQESRRNLSAKTTQGKARVSGADQSSIREIGNRHREKGGSALAFDKLWGKNGPERGKAALSR